MDAGWTAKKKTPTPRHALRAATTQDHARVDDAFSRYDLTSVEGYRGFLSAQAMAFLPLEQALDRSGIAAVLPDWPERRRSAQLRDDLAALEVAIDAVTAAPVPPTPAAQLGVAYVLEGSRLGGQLLARSVPPGLPRTFLDAGDGRLWRTFTEVLDVMLETVADRTAAVDAAKGAFAMFERSARRVRSAASIG